MESRKLLAHLKARKDLSPENFEELRLLGHGGYARVAQVIFRHDRTEAVFALKSVSKAATVALKQLDHLKSEKQIMARTEHPFLVKLIATFQSAKDVHMLMEYVPGGELFHRLQMLGRFSEDETLFYSSEVLLALRYLHIKDIIYRDLKLENILLDARGHIKLADFGFAKVLPSERTFTVCGTKEYMAPEMLMTGSPGYGKGADWWAFGVLLHEMLTGCNPFSDPDPFRVFQKIVGGEFVLAKTLSSTVRSLLLALLTRADRRLGVADNGESIMQHDFFSGVRFEDILKKRIESPWIPVLDSPRDSKYFKPSDEVSPLKNFPVVAELDQLFADF